MPHIWNQSIVGSILKQEKPTRSDRNSCRLIALTSKHSKTDAKAVVNRGFITVKRTVIPSNQAGFRKGRSTIDHLV